MERKVNRGNSANEGGGARDGEGRSGGG